MRTLPQSLRCHPQWADWVRAGRSGTDRPLGANGRARIDGAGDVVLRLHWTDVVTYTHDGLLVLNHGGWRTNTTFAFIDRYAPGRHFRRKGAVYTLPDADIRSDPVMRTCRSCLGVGRTTFTAPACWRCHGSGKADYGSKRYAWRWTGQQMTFQVRGDVLAATSNCPMDPVW